MVITDIISHPYPASSVIPDHCQITIDRRTLVGETQASVLKEMNKALALDFPSSKPIKLSGKDKPKLKEYAISIPTASAPCYTGTELGGKRFFPAWKIGDGAPIVGYAYQAMEEVGLPLKKGYYPFCTDGSESSGNRNIPTIGFGPSSPSLAHTIDEYVEFDQVILARDVYKELAQCFRVE